MKKKYNIKMQFDPNYNGSPGQVFKGESKTQPNMAIPIRTLLKNHSRNLPSGVAMFEGQYFETEIPIFEDMMDVEEWKDELMETQAALKEEIDKDVEAAKAKAQELNPNMEDLPDNEETDVNENEPTEDDS